MRCALPIWLALMVHCIWIARSVNGLSPIHGRGSPFACRSNLHYDFGNIDRLTDNMCAQCLWYMAGSEAPWYHFEQVHKWHVVYNYSDSVNVLLCKPECRPFLFDDLKLALSLSNHSIGSEFKSAYYLVMIL